MGKITSRLHKQIKSWQIFSVIAPAIFTAVSALLYLFYDAKFQNIFYAGLIMLTMTCIIWWHWSLFTMLTMLGIMKDTDDHFEKLDNDLKHLQRLLEGKPTLTVIKGVDKIKE